MFILILRVQKSLELVGKKGAPRHEAYVDSMSHPIPGINVPLRYFPYEHNVSSHDYSVE